MTSSTNSSAITEKVTLGQPITFTSTLKRVTKREKYPSKSELKTWVEAPCKEREGIVVGTRTLWNGNYETEDDPTDGPSSYFVFQQPVPALLVAFALSRKPVLIPLTSAVAALPKPTHA
jgi:hypothetical protein